MEFGTAGYTHNHVFVLYDRESDSVWYPGEKTLEAVGGKRRGDAIPFLTEPAPMPLSEWVAQHPSTTVLLPTEADFQALNRPVLGIGAFSRQEERGMQFERVVEDGPAAAAGLEPGDILISVGGVATNSRDDLRAAMEGREPGEVVEVVIRRGSEQRTVSITLGRAGG